VSDLFRYRPNLGHMMFQITSDTFTLVPIPQYEVKCMVVGIVNTPNAFYKCSAVDINNWSLSPEINTGGLTWSWKVMKLEIYILGLEKS